MFPWEEKEQIKWQLAESLIWVIWQDLLKTKDWKGRVLATELLVNNSSISNMIRKWITHQINSSIETWASDWMYTMQSCLDKLKNEWKI
jgi:twitching motility protein PilT